MNFRPKKEKRLDKKFKFIFKIYDVATWLLTNNHDTHIVQYLTRGRDKGSQTIKFGQLIEYVANIFLQKSCRNEVGTLLPDLFLKKETLCGK